MISLKMLPLTLSGQSKRQHDLCISVLKVLSGCGAFSRMRLLCDVLFGSLSSHSDVVVARWSPVAAALPLVHVPECLVSGMFLFVIVGFCLV